MLGGRLPTMADLAVAAVRRAGGDRVDAALSAGVDHRAPRDRRVPLGDYVRAAAVDRLHEPVRRAPRPRASTRAGAVRPGSLDAGVQGVAAEVRLLSVRRRSAPVHRRVVRVDGARAARRDHRAAVASAAGAGPPGRAAAARHAAREARDADDGGTTLMALRVRRVLETALDCDDLKRSAAFYTSLLGVIPMLEMERIVAIDAGEGTVLLLFQKGGASSVALPGGLVPAHEAGGPGHFAFAVDAGNLAAWEARLAGQQIAIESRVTWERGGVSLYFRDPDNRLVELATPGVWPSY